MAAAGHAAGRPPGAEVDSGVRDAVDPLDGGAGGAREHLVLHGGQVM